MDRKSDFQEIQAICDTLTDEQDDITRQLLTRITDKWSLWVMGVLAAEGAPLRFARVKERVEQISQKSLTTTLRQLERDGLVTRTMYLEMPPRVEYEITPTGLAMLDQVKPLWLWIANNVSLFVESRSTFDLQKKQ